MDFIKSLFQRKMLIKYAPDINKRLEEIKTAKAFLDKCLLGVNKSYSLIPVVYLNHIKKQQTHINNYIKSENVFSFNNKLEQKIAIIPYEKWTSQFKHLDSTYKDLSKKYLLAVNDLDQEIQNTNAKLKPYYLGIKNFNKDLKEIKNHYISNSVLIRVLNDYEYIKSFFQNHRDVNKQVHHFFEVYSKLDEPFIKEWNKEFVSKGLLNLEDYFSNIDGKSLDNQQRQAVVVDEDANLVVAGAGSGKTLTISGKVKYLVETKGIQPEEILLVSFTRKAANEMEERIKKRLDINVNVNTFHSLGMSIISKHKRKKPDVADNAQAIIKKYFDKEMYDDPQQLKRMIEYFGYYLNVPIDLEKFNNLGEAYEYQKNLDLETLKSKYLRDGS